MGNECQCALRMGRRAYRVAVHLDSQNLTFRGEHRRVLPLAAVKSARAGADGVLAIATADETLRLSLPDRATAEKWGRKILHPPGLLDKLGVKPASRVAVVGVDDPAFRAEVAARTGLKASAARDELDFIVYAADSADQLARLGELRRRLQPAGAIWVVSRKGGAARIRDTDVMAAARTAGLVDVKVCSFSATHTALKLVIPVAQRRV